MSHVPVKQFIFDYYANQREQWLREARQFAKERANTVGEVSADDVHESVPIPEGVERRTMGKVFDGMRFIRYQKSRRQICHHRVIAVFKNG